MKEAQILKSYEVARERYAELGVDTDKAVEILEATPISLHCWQTDDVMGFESDAGLSGGIQTTGNYPGRARNIDEVRKDVLFAKSLIAGSHRLNLHEIYGDFQGKFVDRDEVEVKHFESWIQWAEWFQIGFQFTSFGHPKAAIFAFQSDAIREFWIEHTKRCRRIADAMAKLRRPCIMNIWVLMVEGFDCGPSPLPQVFAESLDEILEGLPDVKTCLNQNLRNRSS